MSGYDVSKSNLLLMVGGQIMLIALAIMVVCFGVGPLQFAYAEQMREMLSQSNGSSVNASKNASSKSA